MPTKFLESLGGKLGEQWVVTLLTPALVFWLGGLGAWVWQFGWKTLQDWLTQQPETLQVATIVGSLLIITASAFVIQKFDLPVLRFLEGYWPQWMHPLRHQLVKHQYRWLKQTENRWQALKTKHDQQGLTNKESYELAWLEWKLSQVPSQVDQLMPTKLGNLLKAAESYALNRYGLDSVICWPQLWLVLPDSTKKELQEARAELNTAVRVWFWSLLFLVWTIWAWWVVSVSVLSSLFAYYWMLEATATYTDLLKASFDVHRPTLYKSLRWPLPKSPAQEHRKGLELTAYLQSGFYPEQLVFTEQEYKLPEKNS